MTAIETGLKPGVTQLRDFLYFHETGNGHNYYIKTSNPPPALRNPEDEYKGYCQLRPYLNMPPIRMLNHGHDYLVVQEVKGTSVEDLMNKEPQTAVAGYDQFISDMWNMWRETQTDFDKEQIARDMRPESIHMIYTLAQSDEIRDMWDKRLIINGQEYPSLKMTMRNVLKKLRALEDPVMILRHGDEHIGNILVKEDGEYSVIDPAYVGYGSPAQAINNMIGSNYIFFYHYDHKVKQSPDEFVVDFRLQEQSQELESLFKDTFQQLLDNVDSLSDKRFLTKEYLFVNFMRCVIGKVARPGDISEVLDNKWVYLALANKFYYSYQLPEL